MKRISLTAFPSTTDDILEREEIIKNSVEWKFIGFSSFRLEKSQNANIYTIFLIHLSSIVS